MLTLVIDDMNFDLANLCDMHPDGTININYICMFDINLIQLNSFIMGTNGNSKNINVSHDVIPEEREKLKERK